MNKVAQVQVDSLQCFWNNNSVHIQGSDEANYSTVMKRNTVQFYKRIEK